MHAIQFVLPTVVVWVLCKARLGQQEEVSWVGKQTHQWGTPEKNRVHKLAKWVEEPLRPALHRAPPAAAASFPPLGRRAAAAVAAPPRRGSSCSAPPG